MEKKNKKIENIEDRELLETIFYQNTLIDAKLTALLETSKSYEMFNKVRLELTEQGSELEEQRVLYKELTDNDNLTEQEQKIINRLDNLAY